MNLKYNIYILDFNVNIFKDDKNDHSKTIIIVYLVYTEMVLLIMEQKDFHLLIELIFHSHFHYYLLLSTLHFLKNLMERSP